MWICINIKQKNKRLCLISIDNNVEILPSFDLEQEKELAIIGRKTNRKGRKNWVKRGVKLQATSSSESTEK